MALDLLEMHHRLALAREMTYAAGFKLRDRYGFAASDETVARILDIVSAHPDDSVAVDEMGAANMLGDIHIAMDYDTPTDEEYDLGIVQALRPLIEKRRDAAVRGLS